MRALATILVALAALPACARCTARRDAADAGPRVAPKLPDPLPAPKPWTFSRVRVDPGLALPGGCRLRAPTARAEVSQRTRFVAEPRTMGTVIVADPGEAGSDRLAGVAALTIDPEGISRDPRPIPWFEPAALPRIARSGARWVAAMERAGSVLVWRGGEVDTIGEGDGFEPVDLACGPDRCAILAPRPLPVAAPGAAVWIGSPSEPATGWRLVEILPSAAGEAHPFDIAAFDAAKGHATIAMIGKGEIALYAIAEGAPREVARLPAQHGAIDAIATPKVMVMESASAVDDEGCARDGRPGVRFVREGTAPVDFALPAPPARGYLRPLGDGAIAVWIAPVGCRMARRVVYAIVLDASGSPVGTPVPVGDASGFAVVTAGAEVDLWLQDASSVTWVRARCAPH